jgi:CBS-domain-containing membrane protein
MPAGYPWLFPSLGPTAYLQAESPAHPASRFYNTVVGHGIGLVAGFLAVFLLNAYTDPVVLVSHSLTWERAGAAALALALTLGVALLLKASHPPAGATTLLVALGAFKLEDIPTVVAGVLIVAVVGELARRLRLGQLRPTTARPEARLPAPTPKPQS